MAYAILRFQKKKAGGLASAYCQFDTVQRLIISCRREPTNQYENIFAGIIKCDSCGYRMTGASANRRKRPDPIDCVVYHCGNYTRYGTQSCTSHKIEARDFINAVLADINRYAILALQDENAVKQLQKRLNTMEKSEEKAYAREKSKLTKRLNELDRLFSALYEDKVMERVSERNYSLMADKYTNEQATIESRLQDIEGELQTAGNNRQGITDFLSLITNYKGITELTSTIVNTLIDKIVISECKANDSGELEQEVRIYYKFVGSIHELQVIPTSRYCVLPEKECIVCGKLFIPGSSIAKFCSEGCKSRGNEENS